jgi:RNA-directed DNA polymerase
VRIGPTLLKLLDVKEALRAELEYQPPYLPASIIRKAVDPHIDDAAKQLTSAFRTGYDVPPAEIIQVPKRRGGLRPVAVLDLTSRVLYRTLCDVLTPDLAPVDRSWEAKRAFEQAPLSDNPRYVVIADRRTPAPARRTISVAA